MSKKPSFKKILILVTILVLPGFLYYLLQEKGENRYKPLPVFGPKEVAKTFHSRRGKKIPDTIYHTVRNFKLLNQNGDPVGLPTDSNRIAVVSFFFTRCKSVCVHTNSQIARIAEVFAGNKRLEFYSISVDPEFDQPAVLKSYAAKYEPVNKHWHFLTGEKDLIFDLAKKDFLVDALEKDGLLIHSPRLILLDSKKRIRGYYDPTGKEQIEKLIDEIKVLITEELRAVTSLKIKK
jgi:protein SCO1